MHDGPPYTHTRSAVAVRTNHEALDQFPSHATHHPPRPAQSSKRGGGGDDTHARMHENEWKKKAVPLIRIPQPPDNTLNRDLWAQILKRGEEIYRQASDAQRRDFSLDEIKHVEFLASSILTEVRGMIASDSKTVTSPSMSPTNLDISQSGDIEEGPLKKRRGRPPIKKPMCCQQCGTTETPEWRRGEHGPNTLCNGCGLRYAKRVKMQEEATRDKQSKQKPTRSSTEATQGKQKSTRSSNNNNNNNNKPPKQPKAKSQKGQTQVSTPQPSAQSPEPSPRPKAEPEDGQNTNTQLTNMQLIPLQHAANTSLTSSHLTNAYYQYRPTYIDDSAHPAALHSSHPADTDTITPPDARASHASAWDGFELSSPPTTDPPSPMPTSPPPTSPPSSIPPNHTDAFKTPQIPSGVTYPMHPHAFQALIQSKGMQILPHMQQMQITIPQNIHGSTSLQTPSPSVPHTPHTPHPSHSSYTPRTSPYSSYPSYSPQQFSMVPQTPPPGMQANLQQTQLQANLLSNMHPNLQVTIPTSSSESSYPPLSTTVRQMYLQKIQQHHALQHAIYSQHHAQTTHDGQHQAQHHAQTAHDGQQHAQTAHDAQQHEATQHHEHLSPQHQLAQQQLREQKHQQITQHATQHTPVHPSIQQLLQVQQLYRIQSYDIPPEHHQQNDPSPSPSLPLSASHSLTPEQFQALQTLHPISTAVPQYLQEFYIQNQQQQQQQHMYNLQLHHQQQLQREQQRERDHQQP